MDNGPSESSESALYFLSTQIQANYEDQEHRDAKMSQLSHFRNAAQAAAVKMPAASKTAKPRRKATKKSTKNTTRSINSISSFVRETLGGKKPVDPQILLSHFSGDQRKLDEFLNDVEEATATPHLLSKKSRGQDSLLFTGPEWKRFSETLRLRFPGLTKGHRKSLKVISKRLALVRGYEALTVASQDPRAMWAQASRQPSEELSKEDLVWLYDLDKDQMESETSMLCPDETPDSPACLTLSQVLDDRNHIDEGDRSTGLDTEAGLGSEHIHSGSDDKARVSSSSRSKNSQAFAKPSTAAAEVIEGSESELEPLLPKLNVAVAITEENGSGSVPATSKSTRVVSDTGWPVSAYNTDTLSATTSPNPTYTQRSGSYPLVPDSVLDLPIKHTAGVSTGESQPLDAPFTPRKSQWRFAPNTPSCLRIDSSPLLQKQCIHSLPVSEKARSWNRRVPTQESIGTSQEIYLSASTLLPLENASLPRDPSGVGLLPISPYSREQLYISPEFVRVAGRVELDPRRSTRVQLVVVPPDMPAFDDVIPDSEEDDEAELSIIEITKPEAEDADAPEHNNTSVLQVPSSPEMDHVLRPWESRL